MREQIPVTVLSGFLGSGKTTLLNKLLKAEHGLKLAVIVNEFGSVGIDSALVQGGEQFVALDNGCLCCVLNETLDKTVRELAERGGFDHLVIETTGLADPMPVGWTFTRPGLSQHYRVDALVTVVDAVNLNQVLESSTEAQLQIEGADVLIINKVDLVKDQGQAVEKRVREFNPNGLILFSSFGRVDWELVLGFHNEGKSLATYTPKHQHSPFESWCFQSEQVFDDEALENFLTHLSPNIYRMKGLVETNAEWRFSEVHVVAGRYEMRPYEPKEKWTQSALVFIGKSLSIAELQASCEQALLHNALKFPESICPNMKGQ
jgi:G3E family GTPase